MAPKFFDIHTHLNFSDFYSGTERDQIIEETLSNDTWMVLVGTDFENSKKAIEIAEKYEKGVYATVGLHPTDEVSESFDIEKYREIVSHPKVVLVGECGIEVHPNELKQPVPIRHLKEQKKIFRQQIELAIETKKSLMIHCRSAHEEVLSILKSYKKYDLRGNIHFFSGTWKQAQEYIDLGFMISFTGVITFACDFDETIRNVPLDKMMIETDAPFVTPVPHRGKKNQPLYVEEVAKKIAEIRGISLEEVSKATTKNSLGFLGLA